MKKTLSLVALSTLALAGSLEGCSSLKCGDGTKEVGGVCVVDDSGGLGGEGGDSNPGAVSEFDGVLAVGSASETSILVTWIPVSDPNVSYNVYVATKSGAYNVAAPQVVAPAGSASIEVTGLETGKEYFVVVYAVVNGEVVTNKAEASAKAVADTVAPAFTGAKKATTADGSSVKLSWDVAKDDLSPEGALVYFVYAGESEELIDLDVPLGVSNPGATSTTVQLPIPDKEYFFVVRVRDAAGNLDDNTKVLKAKSGKDNVAPIFSGCTSATAKSASAISVTFLPASDDSTLASDIVYNVYAATTPTGHNFAEPNGTAKGATTVLVEDLEKAKKYYLVCRAADASGNEDANTRIQSATTKSDGVPPVFAGLKAVTTVGSTTVELSWDPATDNQTKAEDMLYDVFLSATSGAQDFESPPFATSMPGAASIVVPGLSSRKKYFVVVRARDSADNLNETVVEDSFTTKVSLLNDIVFPIFLVKCVSGCHDTTNRFGNMSLEYNLDKDYFTETVGVNAATTDGAGQLRVKAGDPANSHLIKRLRGIDVALQMPYTGDVLTEDQITTVEAWIAEGALDN